MSQEPSPASRFFIVVSMCVLMRTAEYAAGRSSVTNGLSGAMSVPGAKALKRMIELRVWRVGSTR